MHFKLKRLLATLGSLAFVAGAAACNVTSTMQCDAIFGESADLYGACLTGAGERWDSESDKQIVLEKLSDCAEIYPGFEPLSAKSQWAVAAAVRGQAIPQSVQDHAVAELQEIKKTHNLRAACEYGFIRESARANSTKAGDGGGVTDG